jgi:hypothetical protein
MKKNIYLLLLILFISESCAVLDRSYSFKTSSQKWIKHFKHTRIVLFDYQDEDRLFFTYSDDSIKYVVYPEITYVAFLWAPVIIPCIPNIFPTVSGKSNYFCIDVKCNTNISPGDMVCVINGKKIYPKLINYAVEGDNSIGGWYADSIIREYSTDAKGFLTVKSDTVFIEDSPYITPRKWGNFPPVKREDSISSFRYWYRIKNVDVSNIEIYFSEVKEPLYLKRKKGLQYSLDIMPMPSYR